MITTEEAKDICNQLGYPFYTREMVLYFSREYEWADMNFYNELISAKNKPSKNILIPSFEANISKPNDLDKNHAFLQKLILFDNIVEDSISIAKMLRDY